MRQLWGFHPAAGRAGLAAVVCDHLKFVCERIERAQILPYAARRPALDVRIESAGRQHDERRPAAFHHIVYFQSVKSGMRHRSPVYVKSAMAYATSRAA